jgi:hypothetical protein
MKWKDALFYTAQALNKLLVSSTTGLTSHHLQTADPYNAAFDNHLREYQKRQERLQKQAKKHSIEAKLIQKWG